MRPLISLIAECVSVIWCKGTCGDNFWATTGFCDEPECIETKP